VILAQAFQRFVLDLDGVVWTGDEPVPGAPETIRSLRDAGKRLAFVTNNSSQTPETYAKKLADVGAQGDAAEVVTSADAVARLMAAEIPALRGRSAFVIGGPGLVERVAEAGVRISDGADPSECSIVVVGFDLDLTYEKLRRATLAIRGGAAFIASNADATYPAPDGLWPGCGATVAALRASTGAEPLVAGKPQPLMLDVARERVGGTPALVVGDRIDTDVLAAQAVGWPSALVLTGATGVPELAVAPAWPDFVLRRLAGVLEDLPHPQVRQASGPDLPSIASLLHDGGLPAGGARERLGRTVVAQAERRVIGTAAWEPVGDDALLRSVAIAADVRWRGVGMLVVAATLRQAARTGIRDVYLVTANAESFFARSGFRTIVREELPPAVGSHRQITRECPDGAPVMRLTLPPATSRQWGPAQ
jgi:phosphoglycolate/pyridoxal phosphate phosphatase family enzyme